MRRRRSFKRGRLLSIVAAGFAGYLLGIWHGADLRSIELSPSQSVALRFPEANLVATDETAAIMTGAIDTAGAPGAPDAGGIRQTELALFDPEPMVPQVASTAPPQPQQTAALPAAAPEPTPAPSRAAAPQRAEPKPPIAAPRYAERPGTMLNDAQIASIKERLHLTPDQQRMWPAVEAALRNLAYAKAHDPRRRGTPDNPATASLDPESAQVQGLKSAAIPLIMSFDDEQKNEVRSLAHVMGLDKLASEL